MYPYLYLSYLDHLAYLDYSLQYFEEPKVIKIISLLLFYELKITFSMLSKSFIIQNKLYQNKNMISKSVECQQTSYNKDYL